MFLIFLGTGGVVARGLAGTRLGIDLGVGVSVSVFALSRENLTFFCGLAITGLEGRVGVGRLTVTLTETELVVGATGRAPLGPDLPFQAVFPFLRHVSNQSV